MLKKVIQFVILLLLISFLGVIFANKESLMESMRAGVRETTKILLPCSQPIEYSVGEVDDRFGISKDQLISDVAQAEKIWEDSAGKDLFKYVPGSPLKINLVFDERQVQIDAAEIMENKLENLDSAHNSTVDKYNSLLNEYKIKSKEYKANVVKYEKKLDNYNNDIEYWSSRGGAPEDEYKKLQKEKEELDDMFSELEKERKYLNDLSKQINQAAKKENEIVSKYNSEIKNYKDKFGESREFEKGTYDGESINIYEFKENEDLLMTIIHEMGHALGIGHLDDPSSIMYYLMGEQDMENPRLTEEDISALKNLCQIK